MDLVLKENMIALQKKYGRSIFNNESKIEMCDDFDFDFDFYVERESPYKIKTIMAFIDVKELQLRSSMNMFIAD